MNICIKVLILLTALFAVVNSADDCLNPTGDSCNWYLDCLEENRPCAGTEHSYAVEYGNVYCNLFSRRYQSFSRKARQWIDAVRKCLQVSIADILTEENNDISCEEISRRAFDSHACCYVNPSPGSDISICNLGFFDKLKISWTIRGSLLSQFLETVSEMASVRRICASNSQECNEIIPEK